MSAIQNYNNTSDYADDSVTLPLPPSTANANERKETKKENDDDDDDDDDGSSRYLISSSISY
jgi:hypothetical protein